MTDNTNETNVASKIIEDAKRQAEEIILNAKKEADKILSESEILKTLRSEAQKLKEKIL